MSQHHVPLALLRVLPTLIISYHLLSALPTECSLSYSTAYTILLLTAPATTRDPRTCSLAETSCMCLCPYLNGRLLLIVLCHRHSRQLREFNSFYSSSSCVIGTAEWSREATSLFFLIVMCHRHRRTIERLPPFIPHRPERDWENRIFATSALEALPLAIFVTRSNLWTTNEHTRVMVISLISSSTRSIMSLVLTCEHRTESTILPLII